MSESEIRGLLGQVLCNVFGKREIAPRISVSNEFQQQQVMVRFAICYRSNSILFCHSQMNVDAAEDSAAYESVHEASSSASWTGWGRKSGPGLGCSMTDPYSLHHLLPRHMVVNFPRVRFL